MEHCVGNSLEEPCKSAFCSKRSLHMHDLKHSIFYMHDLKHSIFFFHNTCEVYTEPSFQVSHKEQKQNQDRN